MPDTVPMLHLLCGKPAAGKSTLASDLLSQHPGVLIAEDAWLHALYGDQMSTLSDFVRCSAKLRQIMAPHITDLLRQGLSVVLDFQANTTQSRAWMRHLLEQSGAAHQLHFLDTPDDICLSRLRARNASGEHEFQTSDDDFRRVAAHFVPPTADEGFNIVVYRP